MSRINNSSKMAIEFNSDGSIKMPGKGKKVVFLEKMTKSEGVAVVDEKKTNTYPKVQIKCPKCKYKEAYFWTLQTRAGDESETKFYKCANLKCEHTWRQYR